jgi:hypothetical protein
MISLEILSALTLMAAQSGPGAHPPARLVSHGEAKHILLNYLRDARYARLPGFALDGFDSPSIPGFHLFEAVFANPEPGSAMVGSWAVDVRTGDIWSAIVCREMTSPATRVMQRQLRARLHISQARYRLLRRPGPMC